MVPGNFNLKPGDKHPMAFPAGSFKGLILWADTSLAIAANADSGAPAIGAGGPQKLRIAILDATGKVIETLHETIGRGVGADAKVWPTLNHKFKDAAKTAQIGITREDAGTETIAFCLY